MPSDEVIIALLEKVDKSMDGIKEDISSIKDDVHKLQVDSAEMHVRVRSLDSASESRYSEFKSHKAVVDGLVAESNKMGGAYKLVALLVMLAGGGFSLIKILEYIK